MPALFPAQGEQPQFKVYWRHYDNQGRAEEVCLTYHNTDEDWFLLLPEKWDNCITVRRSGGGTDRVTTFSYLHQDSPVDFLQIYTLTGSDRESRATRGGRFVLKRQSGNVVYAAAFTEAAEWRHSIDEEELRSRFRIIPAEWSAGNQ